MKKDYEGISNLFFDSEAHSKSPQICIVFFIIYGGPNICKILNIWEESQ